MSVAEKSPVFSGSVQYDNGSLFCQMTKKCGLILHGRGRPGTLRVEQGKFVNDLNNLLLSHKGYPEVVQDILEDVRQYLDDPETLMQAMTPIEKPSKSSSDIHQDSIVRLLLRVDPLQQQLCELLLEKVVQTAQDTSKNLHNQVLNQLRLLDGLVTTHEFTEQVFEALAAVPACVQRDMIVALPDILHDSCHTEAALKLSALLCENTEETPAILEALGNLYMDTTLVIEMQTRVLSSLKSADVAHLPMLVKYVLNNVTSQDSVVSSLRESLDFCPLGNTATSKTEEDYQLLTVNEIKNSVRFDKRIGEAWCRAIENTRSPLEHKPLDLIFLVVWYSVCQRQKAVELLVRSKARQGHFTPSLLAVMFNNHGQVMRAYAGTVLQLAQALMWCTEPFGSHLYKRAFLCFEGSMRQEVVVNLVTHVGSGITSQMDAALSVLTHLVQEHPRTVAPFGAFFKSMLDFVHNLGLYQFRSLFTLIATVAYRGGSEGGMFRDEFHVYIHKMLSSFCPRSQRVGVVGALMAVQAMATMNRENNEPGPVNSSVTLAPALQEAIELLELCRSSTLAAPHALGLFYDELSRVVVLKQLHHRVKAWIGDTMITDFQDNYVVDVDGMSSELRFGLDNLPDGAIALNLGHLVEAEQSTTSSALTLCPLFRLLRVTEQVLHGDSLEAVDALLGCPVLFPRSDSAKTLTCTATFYCINWFRELVNGFCGTGDSSIREKVVDRIKRIIELQNCVEKWLPAIPGYVPPLAVLDVDSARPLTVVAAKRGKPAKGSKKRKLSSEEDGAHCSEEKSDELEDTDSCHVTEGKFYWSPYVREFDLGVFEVLCMGLQYKEGGTTGFSPKEMLFLLDDLNAKLDHSLSTGKRLPFKDKEIVEPGFSNLASQSPCNIIIFFLRILPHLLSILEETSSYFQLHDVEPTSIEEVSAENNKDVSLCMARLLTILHCVLAWNGFDSPDHRDLLREMLRTISSRVGSTQLTQGHVLQLGRRSFSYLSAFVDSVCDLESGAALVRLLSCLAHRAEMEPCVQDIARRFLCRDWPPRSSTAALQMLLNTFLSESPSVLKALEDIVDEESSDLRGFLNRCSPSIYCKTLFIQLVDCAKALSFDTSSEDRQLEKWNLAVAIFHKVLTTVKNDAVRANLSAALRFGRFFLERFLRGGMPVLDAQFKSCPMEVQALLKNLQQGTRFLQHACGHSKVMKDVGLTGQVPFVKRALESLVFRVKAMLRKHGCQDAFWLGNLKNRDLQGEEILSQATVSEDNGEHSNADSTDENLEVSEDY
ncbi:Fanconi anemia group D2 protein-like isoform X2 [Ornithodoros turicata]|uniref:Fanconi anemia group D2 protein-like isoform X2 n=1 Tax=Ornithodoros turicata TaxID=34597 RepID=UPI00313A1106